ncbi:class III extradiol ring-cleavage dioxygenase [Novosphingobium sp. KA1]|uniref:DODA-type extradiol aromatic ring-opening family dioxygenase n=1 Tax=Novosphingobium sp. (strain KA1) TaxID=164608 RepID=UPI001A901C00|nr:class III extradiol ring-cleavage dioxygenase [Novosphingobium sp. KA1]QSR15872.1 dioxygenase [Novosphingobium sp. KA1]
MTRQPSFYIPHGGGPCFFMPDPQGNWTSMAEFLRSLPTRLPEPPKAILVVSGHWETQGFAFTGAETPALLFDYYGFPQHTYELRFDAPGAPDLASEAARLLREAGFTAGLDSQRGYDHGVFVPLKVSWPEAEVPVVEMSLDRSLDPALHLAAGKALAPLRDQGVLIVGSGMSFHNMRGYGNPASTAPSQTFDAWLTAAATSDAETRAAALTGWAEAPGGRFSHPREEHLLPLMVAAGASEEAGEKVYSDLVLGTAISAFQFN